MISERALSKAVLEASFGSEHLKDGIRRVVNGYQTLPPFVTFSDLRALCVMPSV